MNDFIIYKQFNQTMGGENERPSMKHVTGDRLQLQKAKKKNIRLQIKRKNKNLENQA